MAPEIVPEPRRSPGRRLQPFEVWCATHLRDGPVRVAKVPFGETHGLAHLGALQVHLDFDGEAAFALIVFIPEIG